MDFSLMREFMDRLCDWRVPGNCVSVHIDNKKVFSYTSGYENIEKKTRMSDKKLFNMFSATKPVTALAGLQLYEKGYFLLDDPLYDFIPEYKQMFIKDADGNIREAKNPITLRQLFTMTSGILYGYTSANIEEARRVTNGRMDTLTTVKYIAKDPLDFEPGEGWAYGLGLDVLGAVIEIVSGKKFRDYVKENIFEPLDMNDSYFHMEDVVDSVADMYFYHDSEETDLVKLQMGGSNSNKGWIELVDKHPYLVLGPEFDSGGAGLTCSPSDYSKFALALANGGVGKNGERIISSGGVELMRTNQMEIAGRHLLHYPQHLGYGYGFGVRTMVDRALSGSNGSYGEFGWGSAAGSFVLIDPERKLSLLYTQHMLNPHEEYIIPRIRNVLYTCLDR
ncbi:MAG: beta-lactamase family protein [Oscillospiraceae bacterium]|nr:beta-lactamase family protein [Oscillospiraceae bacterium]